MTDITIKDLACFAPSSDIFRQIDEIFFQSATRAFRCAEERFTFRQRWLGVYLKNRSSPCYVALDEHMRAVGYVVGSDDTARTRAALKHAEDLDAFLDYWEGYPAHFHINVEAKWRGCGVGAKLVSAFLDDCWGRHVAGVHVITGASARNLSFYQRLGFDEVATAAVGGRQLVMLGLSLPQL